MLTSGFVACLALTLSNSGLPYGITAQFEDGLLP
jgi:hypothetical protein